MAVPAPDLTPIREKYTAHAEAEKREGWPQLKVIVYRHDKPIYEYNRNYSMLKTFEPFRQLGFDGVWREYALISPRYSTFQVLDLETLKVIAERPYPQRSWYRKGSYDEYEARKTAHPEWFEAGGYYGGKGPDDKINAEGFCPMQFHVPDILDGWTGEDAFTPETWAKYEGEEWFRDELKLKIGNYGFVGGCIWGDDTSMKVRHIDLSKITEGIVTEEERYGYLEAPDHMSLKDMIQIEDYGMTFTIPVRVNHDTGKISHYSVENLNIAKDENEYYGFNIEERRAAFAAMTPDEKKAARAERRLITPLDEM